MQKLILATNNQGKAKEIKAIFSEYEVLTLKDIGLKIEVEETGTTFEENAYIKAKAIYDIVGEPTLADDSGLMVEALGGAPGVYSARYAGEPTDSDKNNAKLLAELRDVKDRRAKFVCAMVLIDDKGVHTSRGETYGRILESLEGEGGFGYDPLFYSDELGVSFGVATSEQKNAVSHRAKALAKLRESI